MTNSFCVNNDFGTFSAILIGIFLVISACSLDVLETVRICKINREPLRNQQHLFHNHACVEQFSCNCEFMVVKID